MKQLPRFR